MFCPKRRSIPDFLSSLTVELSTDTESAALPALLNAAANATPGQPHTVLGVHPCTGCFQALVFHALAASMHWLLLCALVSRIVTVY